MTVRQLYAWATEHNVADNDLIVSVVDEYHDSTFEDSVEESMLSADEEQVVITEEVNL